MKNVISILLILLPNLLFSQFSTDDVLEDFMRNEKSRYSFTDLPGTFMSSYVFSEIDFNSYDLFSAGVRFSDKDQVLKITMAPLKLTKVGESEIINELKDNLRVQVSQSNSKSNLGLAIGFGNYQFRKKDKESLLKIDSWKELDPNESLSSFNQRLNEAIYNYRTEVNKFILKGSITYNQKFFPIFHSTMQDSGTNFVSKDTSNYFGTKSKIVGLNVSSSFIIKTHTHIISRVAIGASGYLTSNRQNAQKIMGKDIPYAGASLSLNFSPFNILTQNKLAQNANYQKSGFIPSIYLGATWEYNGTSVGNSFYSFIEEGKKAIRTITPNIDFCITPEAQFRIGMPFTNVTMVNGKKQSLLGATFQYTLKIANLL